MTCLIRDHSWSSHKKAEGIAPPAAAPQFADAPQTYQDRLRTANPFWSANAIGTTYAFWSANAIGTPYAFWSTTYVFRAFHAIWPLCRVWATHALGATHTIRPATIFARLFGYRLSERFTAFAGRIGTLKALG